MLQPLRRTFVKPCLAWFALFSVSIGVNDIRAAERTLRFPPDAAIGVVYARAAEPSRENGWLYGEEWKRLGEARGSVSIPADSEVRLDVGTAAALDLSCLATLNPDDLYGLNLRNTNVNDDSLAHVGRLTGLRNLDLDGTRITDVGTRHLRPLNRLIEIRMDGFGATEAGFGVGDETLRTMAIGRWSELKTVSVSRSKVTDKGVAALALLKSLVSVDIGGTNVSDAGVEHLKRLPLLKTLSLGLYNQGCKITDAGMTHVGEITSLEWLDLSGTAVTDEGLKQIRSLTNLKNLSIDNTKITDAGLAHLVAMQNLSHLRAYQQSNIADEGAEHLSKLKSLKQIHAHLSLTEKGLRSLKHLPLLENLSLADAGVTDEALRQVGEFKSLKELWMQGCPVTDQGVVFLGQLQNLEYLLLGDTANVTSEGLRPLTQLPRFKRLAVQLRDHEGMTLQHIAEMRNLTWLSLRTGKVPDGELSRLGRLSLTNLELDVDEAAVNDEFAKVLGDMKSLEQLRVESSILTDDGLRHLSKLDQLQYATISGLFTPLGLPSLKHWREMIYLQIASPYITQNDADDLASALPTAQKVFVYDDYRRSNRESSPNNKDGIRREGLVNQRTELNDLEGEIPPDLSISDPIGSTTGLPLKLSQFNGQIVLVHFFNMQDANIKPTLIKLRQLYAKYHPAGLEIIGIHSADESKALRQFINDQEIAWPVTIDDKKSTTTEWQVSSSPKIFLVDSNGSLRIAGVYFPDLEKAIEKFLQEE